jgi:hypothetical protein
MTTHRTQGPARVWDYLSVTIRWLTFTASSVLVLAAPFLVQQQWTFLELVVTRAMVLFALVSAVQIQALANRGR